MTSKDDTRPIKRTISPQGRAQNTNKFKRENPEHLYATKYQKVQQELGANQPESEPVIIGDVDYATQRIFNKYRFKISPRNDLPIFQARTQILEEIRDNPVVIVTGHTGSGKTTQVPQYILEDSFAKKTNCNIIVTQPRRIAATSLAARVALERDCELGTLVGYKIGLDQRLDKLNHETRLLFVTTGVLLQMLSHSKGMKQYTHIILDEVHDRNIEMDFLLIVIRKLLTSNSPKIILSSATLNVTKLTNYFKSLLMERPIDVPVIKIEVPRRFKIEKYYLDSFSFKLPAKLIDYRTPAISNEMYELALKPLLHCLKKSLMSEGEVRDSILVFLPGIHEINTFIKIVQQEAKFNDLAHKIVVLHSSLSPQDQREAFISSEVTKIILATNIAESSITLPDVKYVIDFCLTKYLETDSATNISSLQTHWTSKNSCKQRTGRVGRVQDGVVYRLIHADYFENQMVLECPPEMMRSPLQNVILKVKLMEMGLPAEILALALDPPNITDIHNSILVLKEVGALLQLNNGVFEEGDGELTFIGRIMTAMPLDVRVSKLLVLGYLFSCLEECIIIGAGLTVKRIFRQDLNSKMRSYSQKLAWSDGSGSDCIALLNAYKTWKKCSDKGQFQDRKTEMQWCNRVLLEMSYLHEMRDLVNDISRRLVQFGLGETSRADRVVWNDKEKMNILKICLAGAFFPNIFTRQKDDHYEMMTYMEIGGHSPFNTVVFKNMENRTVGDLYGQQIKRALVKKEICDSTEKIKVFFDSNSTKVYVTFLDDKSLIERPLDCDTPGIAPGRVLPEIYKCVKHRKDVNHLPIKIMENTDAVKFAEEKGLGSVVDGIFKIKQNVMTHPHLCVVPSVVVRKMQGFVTHVEHCNKFYFQPTKVLLEDDWIDKNEDILAKLLARLQDAAFRICTNARDVNVGDLIVVDLDENKFARGKIMKLIPGTLTFDVYLTDYGFVKNVDQCDLRILTDNKMYRTIFNLPARCFECTLTELLPSSFKSPKGKWIPEAIEWLKIFTENQIADLYIYSVVDDVASVRVLVGEQNINAKLLELGYAQHADESYLSKLNFELRDEKQKLRCKFEPEVEFADKIDKSKTELITQAPDRMCYKTIRLHGPFTPLETSIRGITRASSQKTQIVVDSASVNSVVMESNPQDIHDKFYIAVSITETNNGNLSLRDVTMMPNIPGLGVLMALLFAPQVEIRRDKELTRLSNVLCGLGFDPVKKSSYFAEHDAVFNVDVNFDLKDLEMVNQIRYSMSQLVYLEPSETKPRNTDVQGNLKMNIKKLIIKLLEKPRLNLGVNNECDPEIWGRNIDRSDLILSKDALTTRYVWPAIPVPYTYRRKTKDLEKLKEHVRDLKNCEGELNGHFVRCELCAKDFETVPELRRHLLSKLHKDLEFQLI